MTGDVKGFARKNKNIMLFEERLRKLNRTAGFQSRERNSSASRTDPLQNVLMACNKAFEQSGVTPDPCPVETQKVLP